MTSGPASRTAARVLGLLVAGWALSALAAAPAAAQDRSITCESENNRRENCYIGNNFDQQSVSIERRLSNSGCNRGPDWGTTETGIWVDNGCRAVFRYARGGYSGNNSGYGNRSLTCESENNRYHLCRISGNWDQTSARLERRLSNSGCLNGTDWGTTDDGIWVNNGCRAEFQYNARGNRPGYGNNDGREITCESNDNRRKTCYIGNNIDRDGVRLMRRLSNRGCESGSDWGTTNTSVWVDNGCRAVFTYTSRGGNGYRPPSGNQASRTITCTSSNRMWRHCDVSNMRNATVTFQRGNSACNGEKAWGTDEKGVWVSFNCSATFLVRYN